MEDLGVWEPVPSQTADSFPSPRAPFLAPPAKEAPPVALDLRVERVERAEVPRDRVVVKPPLDHGAKPSARLLDRRVHPSLQLHFDLLQLGPHALGNRFAFDGERALPRGSATMRETQEVERLRPPLPTVLSPFRRVAAKLDQSGLLGVKLEAELLETFPQRAEESLGITSVLESHDEIVGVA